MVSNKVFRSVGFAYWFVGLKRYYKFVPRSLKNKLVGTETT